MESEEGSSQTKLYVIRWWILTLTAIEALIEGFLVVSFGIVNYIYVSYFNVSYETVDWFTLMHLPGIVISSLVFSIIMFNKLVSVRTLSITLSGCFAFTCACLIIAYAKPELYLFVLFGEFVHGFVVVALESVSAAYAINWFPEHQMGFAISVTHTGSNTGSLLGYIIPSNLLLAPNDTISSNQSSLRLSSTQQSGSNQDWFSYDQIRLIGYSSVLLTLAVLVFFGYLIFMKDKPPIPPTTAQAKIQRNGTPRNFDSKQNIRLCKYVLLNKVFVQTMFIMIMSKGCNSLVRVYWGEIMKTFFIDNGYTNSYTSMSGWVLVCYKSGCIVGNILSANVVNHFKNYQRQISLILVGLVVSIVCVILGYRFHNIVVLFLFSSTFGIFIGFLPTPLYEIIFQHFYPVDSGVLALMIQALFSLGILLVGIVSRKIVNFFNGGPTILVLSAVVLLFSFINSLFVNPNYNRLNNCSNPDIVALLEESNFLIDSNQK